MSIFDDGGAAAVVPPVSLNPPLVWGIISKISNIWAGDSWNFT